MTLCALVLLGSTAVSGATTLRSGGASFHQVSRDSSQCIKPESCWQQSWPTMHTVLNKSIEFGDSVQLHNGLEATNCSMKFGIESSAKPGPDGVPLELTVETIGLGCKSGDYLKIYVSGPQGFADGADLRTRPTSKLTKAKFVFPISGEYQVVVYHHFIEGLGEAGFDSDKKLNNLPMQCGVQISPSCAVSSDITQAQKERRCDFKRDDPTKGFWQMLPKHKQSWHPWGCSVSAYPSSEELKALGFAKLAIVGSSRPRTLYFDILDFWGYPNKAAKNQSDMRVEQSDMRVLFDAGPQTDMRELSDTGPDVHFMWGDCTEDLFPGPEYGLLGAPFKNAYIDHFSSFVTKNEVCGSQPSVVVFTIGICEIARSTFESAEQYVRKALRHVAQTCAGHRVIVVSEMAVHHLYRRARFENGMSNERVLMINDVVRAEAQDLGLEFLDAYKVTSSYFPNDSWDPLVHYFRSKVGSFLGNAASREFAKLLLAYVQQGVA